MKKIEDIIRFKPNPQGDVVVSAREMWLYFKQKQDFKTPFTKWIANRLREGFEAGTDYHIIYSQNENKLVGRPSIEDYALTLDTAKHIALIEDKEVRDWFIAREKELEELKNSGWKGVLNLLTVETPRIRKKTFKEDFFRTVAKLHGWNFRGSQFMPDPTGRVIRDWVYSRIIPGLLSKLDKHRKKTKDDTEKIHKLHVFLTEEVGIIVLKAHINKIITLAEGASYDLEAFKLMLNNALPLQDKGVQLDLFIELDVVLLKLLQKYGLDE